jgi:hypothetical protein
LEEVGGCNRRGADNSIASRKRTNDKQHPGLTNTYSRKKNNYSSNCGSLQDFFDRGFLLTRKLLY